ncbi:hypothetical protein JCM10207_000474 [Rhodosporidiobolus poonsookiae]
MSDLDDLLGGFGDFEIEVDDSAAQARLQRIEAARKAGKEYEAKHDEPGWFNDPVQAARSKGPARPALFALHQRYFERQYSVVVDDGIKLMRGGVKEDQEVRDLVMRSALRCGRETQKEVLEIAKQWREFPNLPALAFICARILFANSPLAPSASSSEAFSTAAPSIPPVEVLEASLASLRLHPSHQFYHPLLVSILRPSHPLLADAVENYSVVTARRAEVEAELEKVEASEMAKETLAKVVDLHGVEKDDEEEGVGRDVRSL